MLRIHRLRSACALLVALALPPWLAYFLPSALPGGDPAWYTAHRTGAVHTPTDVAVILLKFHPA